MPTIGANVLCVVETACGTMLVWRAGKAGMLCAYYKISLASSLFNFDALGEGLWLRR